MNLLGEVQELQFAALVSDRGIGANEFANAGAIDICDIAKVEQDFLNALSDRIANSVTENDTALAEK